MTQDIVKGTIERYYPEKRFGFISAPGHKRQFFFHYDDLYEDVDNDRIVPGMRVTFTHKTTLKGPRASNVLMVE